MFWCNWVQLGATECNAVLGGGTCGKNIDGKNIRNWGMALETVKTVEVRGLLTRLAGARC